MGDLFRLHGSDPGALILHEFAVSGGAVRLDIAVVNGSLDGFEIKSASDTLQRLPVQADAYSRVLEFVTIVAAASHVERVLSMVPAWWTVSVAEESDGQVRIGPVRTGRRNADFDPVQVARLLWRDEALAVLRARGLAKGLMSRPRIALYEALARNMQADDLLKEVRSALKGRINWRDMLERGVRRPRPSGRLKLGDVSKYPRQVVIGSYLTPGSRVAGSFLTPRAPVDEPVSGTERRAGEVRSRN
jgi:hypothetical protein